MKQPLDLAAAGRLGPGDHRVLEHDICMNKGPRDLPSWVSRACATPGKPFHSSWRHPVARMVLGSDLPTPGCHPPLPNAHSLVVDHRLFKTQFQSCSSLFHRLPQQLPQLTGSTG
jgi:hypothetical protein